ncbi:cft-1 [Gaeumannomyces tritici R3-111a-1]|uniref:Cft-1 n=1 Tax=Gaeumannomyces tritici (strain R3-111a-1) TaxID=644352 RepID=J3NHU9_GAET3|nr:cft-1 [Gaeumannomyces tritici R3-111a-1]EJT80842.1 cft-1 [Gaeumannomyces tritici R3-111a-1]
MQCYTELTPPSAVSHSLSLPFVAAKANNLVVAKSSLLQIFSTKTVPVDLGASQNPASYSVKTSHAYDTRLNDDEGLEVLGGDAAIVRSDRASHTKIVLIAEFPLSGTVTGLARVKPPNVSKTGGGSGVGDLLLIAFKDAKLSLVAWDSERRSLETFSIHYYEQDELQGNPWECPLSDYANFLVADPGSRCAALKFGPRSLAILPFKQADEDIGMGDWDEALDGPRPAQSQSAAVAINGTSTIEDTPYSPSFVLRLPNLDPALLHPVHLAFLYEYREPTFGILSSSITPSNCLDRKDHLTYTVFTLDLQQKASTTILSVGGLPKDLTRVIALPAPVGGALLVGANELIHIDQSGKANGVAVNPFTKQCTSFGLADHSDLNLRLEGCTIEVLSAEHGELLVVLDDGRLATITFHIDGRTVSGLKVRIIPPEAGGNILPTSVSCLSRIGRNAMFAGSERGDSIVIGWNRKSSQVSRKKSRVQDPDLDLDIDFDDLEDDEDDDDDLYGDTEKTTTVAGLASGQAKLEDLVFRCHDRLISIAPIRDMAYGKPPPPAEGETGSRNSTPIQSELQLVAVVGRDRASSLAIMNREMTPVSIGRFDFPEARGLWTLACQKPLPKVLQGEKGTKPVGGDFGVPVQYDKFMVVAKEDDDNFESSNIYVLTAAGFEKLVGTEFEPAAGFTIEAGTMGNHTKIIQVLKSEVRCYDGDLGLTQIIPMLDEETNHEPRATSASIADPYLLIIRDDSSAFVAHVNEDSEIEEIEKEDKVIKSTKWIAGSLYADTRGAFAPTQTDKSAKPTESVVMFLLSTTGALYIYALPDISKPIYVAEGLCYVPPLLSADYAARKGTSRESLSELMVTDLGDSTFKSPHLILRHSNDDLTIYEPFKIAESSQSLSGTLRFRKLPNPAVAKSQDTKVSDDAPAPMRRMPLRACGNIAGYSCVFLPGHSPSFLIKSSKSTPRVIGLQGPGVRAMSPFHTKGCDRGFIYADYEGVARVAQIPNDCSFAELGLSVKKVPLNMDADGIAYHTPSGVYVVTCSFWEPFELPSDDESHREWAKENITFKPQTEHSVLKVINPVNWSEIWTEEFDKNEVAMCIKSLNLEVSQSTNERRHLITVGTAICKGEDLPVRGCVYVYDLASVVPQKDRPETDKKLKLMAKDEVPRGAVTALSEIGTQGLMLVAQGQKCLVRGLGEDGRLLPVAFMDMNCYVSCAKELPGTGFCAMADAFKGVWFTGYTEGPYKMMIFGKSSTNLEVINVDFLPDGRNLLLVAADAEGNLHIFQFDPEHPKSLQGHLLLNRTTFSTGAHHPQKSLLMPTTSSNPSQPATNGDASAAAAGPQHILMAAPTGVLAAVQPLGQGVYTRLSALASNLAASVPHHAALNPKAYRMPPAPARNQVAAVDISVGRAVVDGALLARWAELGSGRRAEVAGRAGFAGPDEVRAELESALGWSIMAYF